MGAVSLLQKWTTLQAIIADRDLSLAAKVVAARMLDFYNSQTGRCCPSYQGLAEGTGLKKRAIMYAVQELEKRGWVGIDRVKGGVAAGAGRYATNTFRFDFSRAAEDRPTVHDGAPLRVHGSAPLSVHDAALLQKDKSARNGGVRVHGGAPLTVHGGAPESGNLSGKETGKSLPLTPSTFDEWWAAYPKKVGKEAARPVFEKLVSSGKASPDHLLAGARRYTAERVGQDPKYTKHPKTWLNGGQWTDELPARPSPVGVRPSERGGGSQSATQYLSERRARRLAHD